MSPKNAANKCLDFLQHINTEPSKDGIGLGHAKFMLLNIATGVVTGAKAHRWLGYAQGVIVTHRVATLEQMKQVNHEA